jgi:hypothetical protein
MTNYPTGCTIQLAAGVYKSQQLFGANFHGTLQGTGMDVTTIEVLAPLEVTSNPILEGAFDVSPPSLTNKYPMLIIFMAGDITVSDLTFKVSDPNPVKKWCYGGIDAACTIEMVGTADDPAGAGIEVTYTDGVVISNNRIFGGKAFAGIITEGASHCMVLGNNVQNVDALGAQIGLTSYLVGQDTTYCTVVGGSAKTNLYDGGTNNVVVGVNNMRGNPPGPTMKTAMQVKQQLLKSRLRH